MPVVFCTSQKARVQEAPGAVWFGLCGDKKKKKNKKKQQEKRQVAKEEKAVRQIGRKWKEEEGERPKWENAGKTKW